MSIQPQRFILQFFSKEVTIGSVYGITTLDNGNVYINSAEYPFHYELRDTVITVIDSGISYSEYTTEVI